MARETREETKRRLGDPWRVARMCELAAQQPGHGLEDTRRAQRPDARTRVAIRSALGLPRRGGVAIERRRERGLVLLWAIGQDRDQRRASPRRTPRRCRRRRAGRRGPPHRRRAGRAHAPQARRARASAAGALGPRSARPDRRHELARAARGGRGVEALPPSTRRLRGWRGRPSERPIRSRRERRRARPRRRSRSGSHRARSRRRFPRARPHAGSRPLGPSLARPCRSHRRPRRRTWPECVSIQRERRLLRRRARAPRPALRPGSRPPPPPPARRGAGRGGDAESSRRAAQARFGRASSGTTHAAPSDRRPARRRARRRTARDAARARSARRRTACRAESAPCRRGAHALPSARGGAQSSIRQARHRRRERRIAPLRDRRSWERTRLQLPAPQGFPSGQRGRAVNPLAQPSEVRILLPASGRGNPRFPRRSPPFWSTATPKPEPDLPPGGARLRSRKRGYTPTSCPLSSVGRAPPW